MKILYRALLAISFFSEALGDDGLRGANDDLRAVAVSDAVSLESDSTDLKVGDDVCITGYVMDNYCIYTTGNPGVLLDDQSVVTLENPELHSFYCLLDVGVCYNSGFQVLGEKNPDTGLHCPGFELDDTDAVLEVARALGKNGKCKTCTGEEDSNPEYGYRATIKGKVKSLGDGSHSAAGPPTLTDIQVLDESVGCDGAPTIPPLCKAGAAVPAAPTPAPVPDDPAASDELMVGDDVCITGYVMDNYCIYTTGNPGVLLDDQSVVTLENPELHSFYCLLDVGVCYNSGFQVLGEKNPDTGLHCPGFELDDTDAVLEVARALGKNGKCKTCTGEEDSNPEYGYRATIKGKVKSLGDGSHSAAGPPTLTDIQVLDESVGCDGAPTVPPLCKAEPVAKDCSQEFCDNQLSPDFLLRYQINVPDDTTADVCDGCTISMELIYDGEAWISVAFSTDGRMIGSEAVIGLPGDNKVEKYNLGGKSDGAVLPMSESNQTLSDTSIEVKDGQTIMKFTKIMKEAGEIEITPGDNTLLWAHGSSDVLGYHGFTSKSPFELNLSSGAGEEPANETPSNPAPTPDSDSAPVPETGPAKDCTKEFCDNQLSSGYLLRYQINVPDGTTVDACDGCTISMELIYDGDAWVSVAFSTDGQMIGSEAVIGLPGDNKVEKYNLGGKSESGVLPMPESQQTLSDASIEFNGEQTIMKFTKIMKEAGEIEISSADNTFLWAHGSNDVLGYHVSNRASVALNLSSGASETVAVPNKSAWLAHGIMAFFAWGVFVPFAVQSSLLRDLLPKGPLWYKLHRGFNSTAFAFFVVVFAIAVTFTSKEGATHFDNKHQKMGLAMFIMAAFQVSGGVFRPHVPEEGQEKSVVRKSWEVGHRVLGVTLLACGFWQMREGIALYAIKYSVSESGEGSLGIAYWVWIGIMTALIVLGGGYFKLKNTNAN